MTDINAALQMIDVFASVGATHFDLTFTNIEGEKRGFRPTQPVSQIKNSLPKLFPGAEQRQNNIIVRPTSDRVHFVQLDDLNAEKLARVGEAAFLTIQTSPGNHQAWVAVSGLSGAEETKDFSRRLRKGTGADPSASGATRVAGTQNFKRKYEPEFPTIQIETARPGHTLTKEQVEATGLLAAPEPDLILPEPQKRSSRSGQGHQAGRRVWPSYEISLAGAPPDLQGTGPDRSMADFAWCMTAIDWGRSIEETALKLLEISEKAAERHRLHDEGYALITAQNAATAVQRNALKRGRV